MPRRLASLSLSVLLASLMLALLGAAVRRAAAAPQPTPASTYPGAAPRATRLQACINGTADGSVINISAGHYTESVTLNKPLSLVGANAASTTLRALPGQRVITVTGATIGSASIISG